MPQLVQTRPKRKRLRSRVQAVLLAVALPTAGLTTMAGGLVIGAAPAQATTVPAAPAGWSTVFSDNFSGSAGSAPSATNWRYDTGTSYPGGASNWGTGEVESYTTSPSNVALDGQGHLVITPTESNGQWYSGRIETQQDNYEAPAGGQMEITASIEQPNPSSGLGYWPAFWALGAGARGTGATNWPSIGELDVMEDVNALSEVSHTFHCGTDPGGPCNETTGLGSGLLACSGCQTSYHTYSVIVDRTNTSNEQMRFYTDGNLQYSVSESQVGTSPWQAAVDHGFFIILNVAIGGSFPNAICHCTSPGSSTTPGAPMRVGYVAVYTTGGGSSTTTTTASTTSTTAASTTTTTGNTSTTTATSGGSCANEANAGTNISADCGKATSGTVRFTSTGDPDPSGVDSYQASQLANGATLEYTGVNFGTGATQFRARVASGAGGGVSGLVKVVLDSPSNSPIGSFAIGNTGGWSSWETIPANIATTSGTHNVYLEFSSGQPASYVSMHYFNFGT
jgi:hypothetical protein